jgi:hypothetical protein
MITVKEVTDKKLLKDTLRFLLDCTKTIHTGFRL